MSRIQWPMQLDLNRLLRLRGMTQTDLANALGVNHGTVSRYVANRQLPRRKRLAEIARILDCRPSQLFREGSLNDYQAELMDASALLPEADLEEVLALVRAKLARHERGRR